MTHVKGNMKYVYNIINRATGTKFKPCTCALRMYMVNHVVLCEALVHKMMAVANIIPAYTIPKPNPQLNLSPIQCNFMCYQDSIFTCSTETLATL